jgi:hypothetical protein
MDVYDETLQNLVHRKNGVKFLRSSSSHDKYDKILLCYQAMKCPFISVESTQRKDRVGTGVDCIKQRA